MSKEKLLKWVLAPIVIIIFALSVFFIFKLFYGDGCRANGRYYYSDTFDQDSGKYCYKGKWSLSGE